MDRDVASAAGPPASGVLDEAFDRMAAAGFQLPNGFVNHGPMACEALDALGCGGDVDEWSRRFARLPGDPVHPVGSTIDDWKGSLGDYHRLPEWIGHFQAAIEGDGWDEVVSVWVPRLMPALRVVLFHGAIRTAHAVRAVAGSDTPARRAELARALGYWAARYEPGAAVTAAAEGDNLRMDLVAEAAAGALYYLGDPSIYYLHGVTGAMAVELMMDHLSPADAAAGLAQVRAEHAVMYAGATPVAAADVMATGESSAEMAGAAAASGDPHQVKLVEACRRAGAIVADPVFQAASELVTS